MRWNIGCGLTSACNSRCRHCYNASGKTNITQISFNDAKKIVDILAENNVETINYGTGESGLVNFFWNLVEYVDKKGIKQGLTTNGSSVTEKTIYSVCKYINDIDVSLDYPDEDRNNEFRGSPYAWHWGMTACDLLKSSGVNFSIVTCIHALNSDKETIAKFLEICRSYDCEWRINWFKPTGRGKYDDKLKLCPKSVHEIFRYIVENSIITALPDPYFSAIIGFNSRIGAPCGCESFRITPSTDIVPCVYFTKEMKNLSLLTNDFNSVVNSEIMQRVRSRKPTFCKGCEYESLCNGGCTSRAYLEYGAIDAPDAFCYKINGFNKNPLHGLKYIHTHGASKVHENYLCTLIVKPRKILNEI
jgi:radical SAM protein with 4Fe4S-binding SPASM domain